MTDTDARQSLEELMADQRLVELCELQRIGDEILDVISLRENQHSDILAWMFDAREGHGQGDEILRDLLVHASMLACGGNAGLDGRSATAKFFASWPPSRIRTTSFGSAFIARELGMKESERTDLFVIDAQNKFVLAIENKAGTAHSEEQLSHYRSSTNSALKANPRLKDYGTAYLALDRYFDGEDLTPRPACDYWLHLSYDWLKTSATRALMHIERGNTAARLVVGYCHRQTDWENPNDDRALRLAAELHQGYPTAIKELVHSSRKRVEREWLTSKNQARSQLLFHLQNKGAIELLKETQGMASIGATLLETVRGLQKSNVEYSRTWLNLCPKGYAALGLDGLWPVYINIKYSDETQSKFSISLCWNAKSARTALEAEDLRSLLVGINTKFAKHIGSSWRRVVVGNNLTLNALLQRVAEMSNELSKALLSKFSNT